MQNAELAFSVGEGGSRRLTDEVQSSKCKVIIRSFESLQHPECLIEAINRFDA